MIKLKPYLVAAILATASVADAADENDLDELQSRMGNEWVLVKNDRRHQIKAWIKQEYGKRTRSFKIESTLPGKLESYVRLTLDYDNIKKWYYEVSESKLLKKISPTEYIAYVVHQAPPGSPDRDAVLHINYVPQTKTKKTLEIQVVSLPQYLPVSPPFVRMVAENYTTTIMPLDNNEVRQVTEGYIDPGGREPAWVINFIQRIAPYNTQVSMHRRMQQLDAMDYQAPLPFPVYEASFYQ